jgi:hypothetical protein
MISVFIKPVHGSAKSCQSFKEQIMGVPFEGSLNAHINLKRFIVREGFSKEKSS